MRYSKEHKQQTRERIVRAASRRFRSRGSQGAGIGELMRELRLTHGGFYRHFDSKEDLFVEAFQQGTSEINRKIAEAIDQAPPGGELKALIDTFLSDEHCDNAADGCPVTALATELSRRPPRSRARTAFQDVLKERAAWLGRQMPGETREERETRARMLMSGMAGTLNIARVLTDEQSRRRVLAQARQFDLRAAQV
jgi:TetR/AcrR family transcriptional repressor of nem operon